LYPEFSEIAKEEGFLQVATAFKIIAKVEAEHEKRYLRLQKRLEGSKFLNVKKLQNGNAGTADIFTKVKNLRKTARLASIRKLILRRNRKTTEQIIW
jgi:hypothetical protein